VGVRYRRSLFPGQSDRAEFSFNCPSRVTRLEVSSRLMYRKIDQFLLNFLFGENSGITSPVTVVSQDSASIDVGER
jgi:hypothetical protein